MKFELEDRYLVLKRKDLFANLSYEQEEDFYKLVESFGLPKRKCIVIEEDWPEYKVVLKMLEDRVNEQSR